MQADWAIVAAGYPVLLTGIAVLWRVYQKSQRELLIEKDSKLRILEELKSLMDRGR